MTRELDVTRERQGARLARWMMFVDGESMLKTGLAYLRESGIEPLSGVHYESNGFLWFTYDKRLRRIFRPLDQAPLETYALRWHYYTAIQGDTDRVNEVGDRLRALGFEAEVFKKVAKRSKGVDIALVRDFIGHAYQDDYDTAVLVSGDRDFVPLVEEVKRQGKRVISLFFSVGRDPELARSADQALSFDSELLDWWKNGEPNKRLLDAAPAALSGS